MYLVKINRSSIKKNPRAGETVSYQAGNFHGYTQTKVTQVGDEWIMEEFVGERVSISAQVLEGIVKSVGYTTIKSKERPPDWPQFDNQISVSANLYPLYHYVLPRYTYTYLPCEIMCVHCGHKCDYLDLEEQDYDEYYEDDICPQCLCDSCCDYTYEKIEDVIREDPTLVQA